MIISPLYMAPIPTTIFRRVLYLIQDISYWFDRLLVEDLREGDLAGLSRALPSFAQLRLVDWDWDHPSNR